MNKSYYFVHNLSKIGGAYICQRILIIKRTIKKEIAKKVKKTLTILINNEL